MGNEASTRDASKSRSHNKRASVSFTSTNYEVQELERSSSLAVVRSLSLSAMRIHRASSYNTASASLSAISTTVTKSGHAANKLHPPPASPVSSSIAKRIVQLAAAFWMKHIDTLNGDRQLEISCSVFFGMMSMKPEMKQLMTAKQKNAKIESISIKYLDMFGWLLRFLLTQQSDDDTLIDPAHPLLLRLGQLHTAMGIKRDHFAVMLSSLHETFTYYFPKEYTIQEKYAIDVIFNMTANIMTGQNASFQAHLQKMDFLGSLEECLQSSVGREYFYKYLQQQSNDEIVVYLQLLARFKAQQGDTQRFIVAKDMVRTCIAPDSLFAINLSYECREATLAAMAKLESASVSTQSAQISVDFFETVEMEMRRLIFKNHWKRFVENLEGFSK